jgi:hypothetical protein
VAHAAMDAASKSNATARASMAALCIFEGHRRGLDGMAMDTATT